MEGKIQNVKKNGKKNKCSELMEIADFYHFEDEDEDIKYSIYPSSEEGKMNGNIQRLKNGFWICLVSIAFPSEMDPQKIFKFLLSIKKDDFQRFKTMIQEIEGKINYMHLS